MDPIHNSPAQPSSPANANPAFDASTPVSVHERTAPEQAANKQRLPQRVAIVTGGGTGVGRATSLRLAELGYAVTVNYSRSRSDAERTVELIESRGGQAAAIQADVAEDSDAKRLVAETVTRSGRLDVLVNCAGTTEFIPFADLERITDDVWQRLFQVNVVGAFHCARAAREPMLAAGGGAIVNVSSTAAQLAQGSSIPYCCSKAALDNLTVSLARTFAPRIRVNAVAPGFITGRWLENGLGGNYERVKEAFDKALPLGRVCEPDDVAAAIISLVTGSPLVTGQILAVDSGMLIAGFQARIS
ncbi:MAG: SDR family NAD(P)-dependent oxidoreductase [Planctomycetota bacterium]